MPTCSQKGSPSHSEANKTTAPPFLQGVVESSDGYVGNTPTAPLAAGPISQGSFRQGFRQAQFDRTE